MTRLHASVIVAALTLFAVQLLPPMVAGGADAAITNGIVDVARHHNNPTAPQMIQLNAYEGRGNATDTDRCCNTTVAPAVVQSIINRSGTPNAISLNEVCQFQHDYIYWILSGQYGYVFGHTVGLGRFVSTTIGIRPLVEECAGSQSWYGNSLGLRGAPTSGSWSWFSSQEGSSSGELRTWMCKRRNGPSYCTAHIENGQVNEAYDQSDEYRSVALFGSGTGVLAAGDFNLNENETDDWEDAGFLDADHAADLPTAGSSKWDYVWRYNYGNFPHPAYVGSYPHSDHKWFQAYLPT